MNYKLHALITGGLMVFASGGAEAAVIGPIKTAGTINLGYSYNKSASGVGSNSRFLNITESFNSYIWQPWFIRWSGSLGLTFSLQNSSSKGSTRSLNGSLALDILSRSRFPLLLSYTLSNSATQTEIDANVGAEVTNEHQVQTQTFSAFQTYSSWGGTFYSAWYNKNRYDAEAETAAGTDEWGENTAFGLSISRRFELHSIEMTASNSQSLSRTSPTTTRQAISLLHNYSPASEFGVSSNFSATDLEPGGEADSSQQLSAGSSFYWRPEYSDFSVNGSIKAKEAINNEGNDRDLSAQMSGSYRIARSVRMTAGVSARLNDPDGGQRSGSTSQNVGVSYSSDQALISKFTWSWNTGASISNSLNVGGGQGRSNSRSINLSIGHAASRQFKMSERSSMGLSLSQSGGISKTFSDSETDLSADADLSGLNRSLAHSLSSSYRLSGENGATSVWGSLTDNRDLVSKASQQGFQMSVTRNERAGRTSSLTGTLNYGFSRSVSIDSETNESIHDTNSTSSGAMGYTDSRFLGIHRLMLTSNLRLSEVGAGEAGTAISSTWNNRFRYKLGLLSASFNASYLHRTKTSGVNQLYMFRVTRTF